jgi:hypothetical protein
MPPPREDIRLRPPIHVVRFGGTRRVSGHPASSTRASQRSSVASTARLCRIGSRTSAPKRLRPFLRHGREPPPAGYRPLAPTRHRGKTRHKATVCSRPPRTDVPVLSPWIWRPRAGPRRQSASSTGGGPSGARRRRRTTRARARTTSPCDRMPTVRKRGSTTGIRSTPLSSILTTASVRGSSTHATLGPRAFMTSRTHRSWPPLRATDGHPWPWVGEQVGLWRRDQSTTSG